MSTADIFVVGMLNTATGANLGEAWIKCAMSEPQGHEGRKQLSPTVRKPATQPSGSWETELDGGETILPMRQAGDTPPDAPNETGDRVRDHVEDVAKTLSDLEDAKLRIKVTMESLMQLALVA